MMIRRMMTALLACAGLLFAGVSLATAANAEELGCSSPRTSVPVYLEEPGLWSYTYQVSWCVADGRIVEIVPSVVPKVFSSKCAWAGQEAGSETPSPGNSGAWEVFDMSEFSCETPVGGTQSFNPWGIIVISPDGSSQVVRKGIGDRIIE